MWSLKLRIALGNQGVFMQLSVPTRKHIDNLDMPVISSYTVSDARSARKANSRSLEVNPSAADLLNPSIA